MILRARSELGLKGLADVKITRASPVLACQPPGSSFEFDADAGHSSSPVYARSRRYPHSHSRTVPEAPTPDSSFDLSPTLSLISDTSSSSTSSSDSPSDTSFTLSPPPTRGLGLGLLGLFNADGAPFDGRSLVWRGLSRAFLEEAARTWAADPHHRILSVIVEQGDEREEETQERECEDEVQEQEEQERKPRPHGSIRTAAVGLPVDRGHDLQRAQAGGGPRKEDYLALEVENAGGGSALEDTRSRPALKDTGEAAVNTFERSSSSAAVVGSRAYVFGGEQVPRTPVDNCLIRRGRVATANDGGARWRCEWCCASR
ncbi:hypothetical protein DFH09DRAFT_1335675 [Mycena vulgaris]|nr:hypothetical protein DFH09DRAFT_1335675 [Mycena vulgaris]